MGVVACCNSNSDGHPALSHLMYKRAALSSSKGQRESQHLVLCLSNAILISAAHPARYPVWQQVIVLMFSKLHQPAKDKSVPKIPRHGCLQIHVLACISHLILLISF